MNFTKLPFKISYLFFLLAMVFQNSFSQTDWIKYADNPVFTMGEPGTWDSKIAGISSVIYTNGIYKAWYTGYDSQMVGKIGYATSPDGIVWSKYENNPVLVPGNEGEWDNSYIEMPSVLFIDGIYKMWYMGEDGHSNRIGYATSTDGINWEKYSGNPVLDLGSQGEWDATEVMHPNVIFEGEIYHMWYNGNGQIYQNTGYATSEDGILWTKYTGNPVLTVGEPGKWDDYMMLFRSVIYKDNEFKMWYSACDGTVDDLKYYRIGYATSPDGINWNKYENNPVLNLGDSTAWDSGGVITSIVLLDTAENIYKMWYGGLGNGIGSTGYATSSLITSLDNDKNLINSYKFNLKQNFPNPFNPVTTIEYRISEPGFVDLSIYNLLGEKVITLVSEIKNAGTHRFNWNAKELTSGIYFYRLTAGKNFMQAKKLILLK